ncbi:MAG: S1 RNA-binding domain-containing protein [Mariniblastus sp.]|nr:S1 RNA-binding domain-containing protein [Mariniblastus sp.]
MNNEHKEPESSNVKNAAADATPEQEATGSQSPTGASGPAIENDPKPTGAGKPRIQIGTQRDSAGTAPSQPKAVAQAKSNPVELEGPANTDADTTEPEAEVYSTDGLGHDLEAEIEAALGDLSMDSFVNQMPTDVAELEPNSRIKATVARLHGDNVFMTFKGQFEGVVPLSQFKSAPADGELVEVIVKERNEDDGLYELSIPGAAMAVGDWSDLSEGAIVDARVTGSNTGGLEASVNNIRGFIPASQIDVFRVENFGEYTNKKLTCVVIEINPQKKKLVLSHRAIVERENEANRAELMKSLEVGQLRDGTVTKLMDFGAFVDLGGVEGLIHISKLSWDRVTHPKEILKEGESVKVKIERIQADTGKISLSHRDTLEQPWEKIDEKYSVNETVNGTVTKIAQFGAFVKLEPGIEGLVHISEIAHHRVVTVKNYLKEGDQVAVKILSIDPDSQKMSLSVKATQAAPVKEKKTEQEEDEPARELAVSKRDEPLKGGTDRRTGGEDIGLNW